MNITQIRKATDKSAKKLKKIHELLDRIKEAEITELLNDLEELANAIEENLDRIYEADNPTETQTTRQDQYESLKSSLDDIMPALEQMKTDIDEFNNQYKVLQELADNELVS
jgi:phage shock protein A